MLSQTRYTYYSPDDDCQAPLLAFVAAAQHSIRLADFTYNFHPLTEALIARHLAGVDVALVLDRTEGGIASERPEVAALQAAGVPLVLGTSSRHRIMHQKFIVADDVWVLSGSFNFSATAELESNFVDVEENPLRAVAFLAAWQRIHDWIAANEPQPAPPPAPLAP